MGKYFRSIVDLTHYLPLVIASVMVKNKYLNPANIHNKKLIKMLPVDIF